MTKLSAEVLLVVSHLGAPCFQVVSSSSQAAGKPQVGSLLACKAPSETLMHGTPLIQSALSGVCLLYRWLRGQAPSSLTRECLALLQCPCHGWLNALGPFWLWHLRLGQIGRAARLRRTCRETNVSRCVASCNIAYEPSHYLRAFKV